MKLKHFKTPADFRAWLEKNHDREDELFVGYYRKDSGKPSITWQESVDEALCFGWIDGVRRKVDEESYCNRFTPRRAGSKWSAINTRRYNELDEAGRIHPAGRAAFERRVASSYSFESETKVFPPEYEAKFRAKKRAWEYFSAQPPGYRKLATHYVLSAKQEETRQRRLERLIDDSAHERRLGEADVTPRDKAGTSTSRTKRGTPRRAGKSSGK